MYKGQGMDKSHGKDKGQGKDKGLGKDKGEGKGASCLELPKLKRSWVWIRS